MKTVTYRVTLLEPVLVTSLEGDPNSAVSHDYLPGSVLRGAFIGLAMREKNTTELNAVDEVTRRRFFDGQTRFLSGYLVVDGKRSLPAPRSWEQDTHAQSQQEKRTITNRALLQPPTPQGSQAQVQEPGKPKSLGGKFCALNNDGNEVYVVEPKHVINVHTERDRKRGRSLGGDRGTIYRYDALAAGQVFEAIILCDQDEDADPLKALLEHTPETALGGARSAGYGRVALSDVQVNDAQREVGGTIAIAQGRLCLTLLSDVILRDECGQHASDVCALRAAVAARIGVDAEQLEIVDAFKGEGVVGGFNRKWGLPLPQVPTLTMGSTFVFDLPAAPSLTDEQILALQNALKSMEWHGIGERRAEGFGRVAVNWQQQPTLMKLDVRGDDSSAKVITLSNGSKLLWETIEARIKRQRVDQDQLAAANGLKLQRLPPKSQLNRLRQLITSELLTKEPEISVITRFLAEIHGKKAEQHFERARVGSQPMTEWLKTQARIEDKYAALRLIDAMLARAAKLKKQEESRAEVEHG